MSTILDALKKVEEEQDSTSGPAHQRQLDALQSDFGRQRLSGPKLIKWGAMLLVLCLLTAVSFYLFNQDRDTPSQPTPEQAQAQPRPALTREPPPKATRKAKRAPIDPPRIQKSLIDEQPQPNVSPQKPATDRSVQPAPSDRPTQRPERISRANIRNRTSQGQNTSPASQPTTLPRPQTQPSPTETQATPQRQPSPQPPAPPAPARRSAPSPQAPTPNANTYSNVARLTDNSLKVQAIAWSQDSEERMAVINSQIVREGSSVDDYEVVAIQPDEVVVRKGGQMFKAIFGRP